MTEKEINGSFASGGITSYLVHMHENGLFKDLYDIQCFDRDSVSSLQKSIYDF